MNNTGPLRWGGEGIFIHRWGRIYTDEDGDNEGKAVDLQSKAGGLYQKKEPGLLRVNHCFCRTRLSPRFVSLSCQLFFFYLRKSV